MQQPKYTLRLTIALLVLSLLPNARPLFAQGSLTPPGAPAPTMKTLSQIEPRIPVSGPTNITVSGSYYLTGNLVQFASSFTTISNSDVTFDLNGFRVFQGDLGISVAPGLQNVVIRNGSVRSAAYGISASSPVVLENVLVAGSAFAGVTLSSNSIVRDCQFQNNGGSGLVAGDGTLVLRVISSSNSASGIVVGNRSVVRECSVGNNLNFGISGSNRCLVADCAVENNGNHNITVGFDYVVTHCTADGSRTGSGIVTTFGTISQCTANGNALFGIDAVQRSSVLGCIACQNGQSGIHVTYAGNVEQCFCDLNAFCGILSDAGGTTVIINNSCHENGTTSTNNGAGIRITVASGNRIEGNHVDSNYRGIDVQVARNIVLRNTAAFNTSANYNIVAGNSYGPIVSVAGVGDISGTANANHPQANFSY